MQEQIPQNAVLPYRGPQGIIGQTMTPEIATQQPQTKQVGQNDAHTAQEEKQIQPDDENVQETLPQVRSQQKNDVLLQGQQIEPPIFGQKQQSIKEQKPNIPGDQSKQEPKNITGRITSMRDQIKAKIIAHNNSITQQTVPQASQVEKCTKLLQSHFPNHRIDLIIKSLHTMLHQNCKPESDFDDQSFNSGSGETSYANADYMKANILVREREAVRIPFQARLTEEKRIAISYLNHGYGVRVLREHVRDPTINPTRYNNVITTIMKMAFRKLEDFMKSIGHAVVPLNSQDEKVIRAPLTNCQKWLPPDELETFYKFIKIACELESKLEISTPSAIKLYNSCIRQLRQRQANEQDYRCQKMMKGARRLPRITQNMYSSLAHSVSGRSVYQNAYKVNPYQNMSRNNGIINQGLYGGASTGYNTQVNRPPNPRFQPFGQQYNFNSAQMTQNHWKTLQKPA